jgi:hypothetical protein
MRVTDRFSIFCIRFIRVIRGWIELLHFGITKNAPKGIFGASESDRG